MSAIRLAYSKIRHTHTHTHTLCSPTRSVRVKKPETIGPDVTESEGNNMVKLEKESYTYVQLVAR